MIMYSACFEAKEEPDRTYDIIYLVYENSDGHFMEAYIPGKNTTKTTHHTAYLGKCGAEKAESTAVRFAKSVLRPIHLEDALCDITL